MAQLKHSEIIEAGNPLKAFQEGLEKIIETEKQLISTNKLLQDSFEDIKKTNDGKQAKEMVELTEKLAKANKDLTDVQKAKVVIEKAEIDTRKQLADLKNTDLKNAKLEIDLKNKQEKQAIDLIKAEKETIGLRTQLVAKNKELRESRDKLGDINRKLTKEELEQLKDINSQIDKNNKQLEATGDKLNQQKTGIGRYAKGFTDAFSKIGGVFAIITAGIAAIAGLVNIFKQSTGGAEKFASISGKISGAWTAISGAIGGFITNMVSGNFKAAIDSFSNLGDKIDKASEAQEKLNLLMLQNEKANISRSISIRKLQIAEEQLQAIAEDSTITFAARKKALEDISIVQENLSKLELEGAQMNFKIAEESYNLAVANKTGELDAAKILADATINLDNAIAANKTRINARERLRREEARDLFEQELDFNLDIYDRNKTALEKQITAEKDLAEKLKLYKQLQEGIKTNYQQNIDLINKQLHTKLNAAELEKITDEQQLLRILQNAGANEIVANRAREVLMENITFKQDVADASIAIEKQIASESLGIHEDSAAATFAMQMEAYNNEIDFANKETEIINEQAEKAIKSQKELTDATQIELDKRATAQELYAQRVEDIYLGIVNVIGNEFENLINNADSTLKGFLAEVAKGIISVIEAEIVKVQIAAIGVQIRLALAQLEAGGTLNLAKLATATAALLGTKLIAAGARKLLTAQTPKKFAKGVVNLQGEGTETSDSIPAMLSRGESVLTAKNTRESGKLINAIHAGQLTDANATKYVSSQFSDKNIVEKLSENNQLIRNLGFAYNLNGKTIIKTADGNTLEII